MTLIPWRNKGKETEPRETGPASSLQRFREEIDRTFERFFQDPWAALESGLGSFGRWAPAVDLTESDSDVTVRAELPGLDPKDLDITIQGNMLTLAGEKQESAEEKGKDYACSERRFGAFRRSIRLPASIDPDKVTAKHENGVLTIKIEKLQAEKPRRIKVLPAE